jgi:amino acid permease
MKVKTEMKIYKSIYACGITVAATIASFTTALVASQYNVSTQVIACIALSIVFGAIAMASQSERL